MSNRDVTASEARLPQTKHIPSLSSLSLSSVMSIDAEGDNKRSSGHVVDIPKMSQLDDNNVIVSLLEETNPAVLITLRGLIQKFNLCRVSKSINLQLLCNKKEHWRSLLKYAETHTNVDPELFRKGINPLSTVLEMEDNVKGKTDRAAAAMYKAEFRRYVVFRAMKGFTAYKPAASFNDDTWLPLIFF